MSTTVAELCDAYQAWAQGYYRLSRTPLNIRAALKPLRGRWGTAPAAGFTAKQLRELQTSLAGSGRLCRRSVNDLVQIIRGMFKWAAREETAGVDELLPHRLELVEPLKPGRSPARESEPVKPVSLEDVSATVLLAPLPLAAMIQVQWWTGMRSGELVGLKLSEIGGRLTDSPCWIYRPARHKTAYRGKTRTIVLGPQAVKVLEEWIGKLEAATREAGPDAFAPGAPVDALWPMRPLSYYRAIRRLQERHHLARWNPHQVRHAAATRLEHEVGLEAASQVLGHASPTTTRIYVERGLEVAIKAMTQLG
jgi:integrase